MSALLIGTCLSGGPGCNLESAHIGVEDRIFSQPPAHLGSKRDDAPPLRLSPWRPVSPTITRLADRLSQRDVDPDLDRTELSVSDIQQVKASLNALWETLPRPPSIHKRAQTLSTTSSPNAQAEESLPLFPKSSLLCVTTVQNLYLAHAGNRSPSVLFSELNTIASEYKRPQRAVTAHDSIQRSLDALDSFTLFIFDLDAPYQEPQSGISRGPAPQWVNTTPVSAASAMSISRAPFLLWAADDVSRSTTVLPSGSGGSSLTLKGKTPSEVRLGRAWLNDYSAWFTSEAVVGQYRGYDGPCVAWNDPRAQHRILALALARTEPPLSAPTSRGEAQSGWYLLREALRTSALYAVGGWLTARPTLGDPKAPDDLDAFADFDDSFATHVKSRLSSQTAPSTPKETL